MIGAPARTPPPLPGLRPEWSRILLLNDDDETLGVHVLDHGPVHAETTVICVHGNPTWSYLWREVIEQAPADVRVVAIDQIGMGFSTRTGRMRRLAQRIEDLGSIIDALQIAGRIVLMAHDWGGPVALGWASADRANSERLAGIVLTNTAVHQPEHRGIPSLIAAARTRGVRDLVCARSSVFLRGTTAISRADRSTARAFRAPYPDADSRRAISDFVADIPLEEEHPSMSTLREVARGLDHLADVPTLLVWGMRDPVFSPRYLDDLRHRMPHAQVQQFADAGHLVLEDRPDAIADIWAWIVGLKEDSQVLELAPDSSPAGEGESPDSVLQGLAAGPGTAIVAPEGGEWRSVSWSMLGSRVRGLAAGLRRDVVEPGDRVAVLVPPGPDLLAVVYALWRLGATVVVIDAAHKPAAMIRALRGARVDHVIAIRRAAPIVAALRVPGRVIWCDRIAQLLVDGSDEEAVRRDGDDDAVIVFTSGATGVAKPVAYSWDKLAATAQVLRSAYDLGSDDVLVAAFAPWAVMGPLVGISSVIPRMDASRPGSLTASALSDALEQAGGTVMWASPAAIRSVLASAPENGMERERLQRAGGSLRLLLLAGAPVSPALVREVVRCWPNADVRTPYGMTEVLPATDVTAGQIAEAEETGGVLVGLPLPGVEVAIAPLDPLGVPSAELGSDAGVLGEVTLRARHAKSRYDGRAFAERIASRNPGWHRTGDIGRLDDQGRLRIEGRLVHVISTADGPLGPVSLEQAVEAGLARQRLQAAAVGIGPIGTQVVAIVLAPETAKGHRARMKLASQELAERVRESVPEVAAVLWRDRMPVDIRHGAKVDRSKLAAEATRVLAGRE